MINVSKVADIEFYKHCEEKVVNQISSIKGVVSIYKFGSVKAPGNSDLDFFIVVKNDKNINQKIYEILENLDEDERYIAYQHSPIVLNEELAPFLHIIREASNVIHLYGEIIEFKSLSKEEKLAQFLELLILDYPKRFSYIRQEIKKGEIRIGYQFINASKYTINMIKELEVDITTELNDMLKKMDEYLEINDSFRKKMYLLKEDNQKKFILETTDFLEKLMFRVKIEMDKYLESHYNFKLNEKIRGSLVFKKDYIDEINTIEEMNINILNKKIILKTTVNPISFLEFFLIESKIKNRTNVLKKYILYTKNYNFNKCLYNPKPLYMISMKQKIYFVFKNYKNLNLLYLGDI